MKKTILNFLILWVSLGSFSLFSQNQNEVVALGLPGDNLNLYAVLDVFQKSKTLEEFERVINSRDANINNLDLNNDNIVDYISVISYNQGHFYSIALRVSFGVNDYQDVAVIEVSENNAGNIIIQVIGDEALYGENYILEPSSNFVSGTPNPGYIGNDRVVLNDYASSDIVYVNDWPIVMYLFSPSFSVYISPWYWGYYPLYWNPWTPIRYYSYWGVNYHYYSSPYYRRISFVRFPSHYSYYMERRTISPIVVRNRESGVYRSTYEGRTYRKPQAPSRLSRTEIQREVRRSSGSPLQSSDRQDAKEQKNQSGLGRDKRPSMRESDKRQAMPAQRQEERRTMQKSQKESDARRVTPAQGQENRQPAREQKREAPMQQPQSNQRQENRQPVREQKREAPMQQQQSTPGQENRQSTRGQMQPNNGSPTRESNNNRQMRQSNREIKQLNRSENKK